MLFSSSSLYIMKYLYISIVILFFGIGVFLFLKWDGIHFSTQAVSSSKKSDTASKGWAVVANDYIGKKPLSSQKKCKLDMDNDGVCNWNDFCIDIYWAKGNYGCPASLSPTPSLKGIQWLTENEYDLLVKMVNATDLWTLTESEYDWLYKIVPLADEWSKSVEIKEYLEKYSDQDWEVLDIRKDIVDLIRTKIWKGQWVISNKENTSWKSKSSINALTTREGSNKAITIK